MISSKMGTPRWESLRSSARRAIVQGGFLPLNFEDLPYGPIEGRATPGDLGIDLARRADMLVAVIGDTLTEPVQREIQTALDRRPRPPIAAFFDETSVRDELAVEARRQLESETIIGGFRTAAELGRLVSRYLAQKVHLARRNRAQPTILDHERITVVPGEEERRRYMLLAGDTLTVLAESVKPDALLPRQKFHLGVFDGQAFVDRTSTTPYTEFPVGADRFTFETTIVAQHPGFHHVVVRRPWWFQLGRAVVKLTVTLTRGE